MVMRLNRFPSNFTLWIVAWACSSLAVQADVTLHGLFSDNMILQRGTTTPVWGWAQDGEQIKVQFRGHVLKTTSVGGVWVVRFKDLTVGQPGELRVTGKNTIILTNVLVGEVWIASGQSNMEWPLRSSYQVDPTIALSANPSIRLYTVPKLKADEPTNNVNSRWLECGPATVPSFSAVGYFFARDLQKSLGVPVGVIHTSWGGSPAEAWMGEHALATNPEYKRDILDAYTAQFERYQQSLVQFQTEQGQARKDGKPFTKRRPNIWKPAELYNGMIAPLIPFAIKGAIWYQGESNAGRAWQYRNLFPDMIRNWRANWGQGDFPFLAVQLAPFREIKPEPGDSDWAELREAQLLATKTLPRVGMAVITDVGEEKDIHPRKKAPVGARLALAAMGLAYPSHASGIEYSGPVYRSMNVSDGKAVLTFDHARSGLEARRLPVELLEKVPGQNSPLIFHQATGEVRQPLVGFAIAGEDRKFVWAQASIQSRWDTLRFRQVDKVVVSSPLVPKPIAVRYGWADFPVVNLWNKDGLPATPFRTDDFHLSTAPKAGASN